VIHTLLGALAPRMGLSWRETARGWQRPTAAPDAPRAPLTLDLEIRVPDLSALLDPASPVRDRLVACGRVDLPGLAAAAPILAGTVELALTEDGQLRYRLDFLGADGRMLCLEASRDWALAAPLHGLRRLTGEIIDRGSGVPVATCTATGRAADLLATLRSLRLQRGTPSVLG